jgi:MSHA biogenesis protein MshQ
LHNNRVAPNFFNDADGVAGQYRVDVNVIYNEAESIGGIRAANQLSSNQFTKSDFASSGYGSRAMEYREVGVIDLRAELVNNLTGDGRPALGAPIDYARMLQNQPLETVDTVIQGRVLHVGRFYPEHFDVSLPTLTPRADTVSCSASDFTYMDEPFGLSMRLNAMSADNTATVNYRGAFARLGTYTQLGFAAATTEQELDDMDQPITVLRRKDRLANVNFANGSPATFLSSWTAGQLDISGRVTFTRQVSGVPDGPYESVTIAALPTDSDAVTVQNDLRTATILDGLNSTNYHLFNNQHDFRYGRLLINNAFGSELENLPITLRAEYFDGQRFVTNSNDSCTILNSAELAFVTSPNSFDPPSLASSPTLNIVNNISSVVFRGQIQGVQGALTPTDPTFTVIAPGEGFTGTVDLELDLSAATGLNLPWLQFKWPHDDQDYNENPRATLEFGQFRSHDRVINWQEIYNGASP